MQTISIPDCFQKKVAWQRWLQCICEQLIRHIAVFHNVVRLWVWQPGLDFMDLTTGFLLIFNGPFVFSLKNSVAGYFLQNLCKFNNFFFFFGMVPCLSLNPSWSSASQLVLIVGWGGKIWGKGLTVARFRSLSPRITSPSTREAVCQSNCRLGRTLCEQSSCSPVCSMTSLLEGVQPLCW